MAQSLSRENVRVMEPAPVVFVLDVDLLRYDLQQLLVAGMAGIRKAIPEPGG